MDSLSQIVDVVIGVDTHVATHSAAAVDTRTGGVLAEVTVEAAPEGYEALVQFANEHPQGWHGQIEPELCRLRQVRSRTRQNRQSWLTGPISTLCEPILDRVWNDEERSSIS